MNSYINAQTDAPLLLPLLLLRLYVGGQPRRVPDRQVDGTPVKLPAVLGLGRQKVAERHVGEGQGADGVAGKGARVPEVLQRQVDSKPRLLCAAAGEGKGGEGVQSEGGGG